MNNKKEPIRKEFDDLSRMHKTIHRLNIVLFSFLVVISVAILITIFLFIYHGQHVQLKEMKQNSIKYGLIESHTKHYFLKSEVREAMNGLRREMARHVRPSRRAVMMNDEELESYSIILYQMSVLDNEDPYGFLANTAVETGFNKRAVSKSDAKGINQMMPYMFDRMNESLMKYGKYDIFNVYHNTEAATRLWVQNKRMLEYSIKRPVTIEEVSWAYNAGFLVAINAMRSKDPKNYLPNETYWHGKKVMFYYTNYKNGNFDVWWFAKDFTNK